MVLPPSHNEIRGLPDPVIPRVQRTELLNGLRVLAIEKPGEMAVIKDGKLLLCDMKNAPVTPYIQELEMELAAIEKGGFEHFMLKEIFEQTTSIADCMRGRLDVMYERIIEQSNNVSIYCLAMTTTQHKTL